MEIRDRGTEGMEDCREEDASTVMSDFYSSCDEGSDLERYSSANSFLGTSSLCSSAGNRSEYFDVFSGSIVGDDLDGDGSGEENRLRDSSSSSSSLRKGRVCETESEIEKGEFWLNRVKSWSKSSLKHESERKRLQLQVLNCSSQCNDDGKECYFRNGISKNKQGHLNCDNFSVVSSKPQTRISEIHSDPLRASTITMDSTSAEVFQIDGKQIKQSSDGDVLSNEIFFDMENILLDLGETASTSFSQDVYPLIQHFGKIDWVQTVGSKRKKGDVSLGVRLIGVKEYTVYRLQVRSGRNQWEVERRYRDFFSLYRQLNSLFKSRGFHLPQPWSKVRNESWKVFGNTSQNVIDERTTLIQDCLSSILKSKTHFGAPSSLVWFLSPNREFCKSNLLKTVAPETLQRLKDDVNSRSSYNEEVEKASTLVKTVSLVLDILPRKPISQLLKEQHHTCAGCHKFLDTKKSLMQDVACALGWGDSRFCEYTGRVFCKLCHTGDAVVLPAKILHKWDFCLSPVSQLAKSYLHSIYDKPILSIGAVNPLLFSRVPALARAVNTRKKIDAALSRISCSFRKSVGRDLGSRRYLLEANDFFSLRDLVDLSKGAFAAIPAIIEHISSKIQDHIMQECMICYEIGIPCAAQQNCSGTSSTIFPFLEPDAIRCASCGFISHGICLENLCGCSCDELVTSNRKMSSTSSQYRGMIEEIELDEFVNSPMQQNSKPTKLTSLERFIPYN